MHTKLEAAMRLQATKEKKILYLDMDGPLVDFESGIDALDDQKRKQYEGAYDACPGIFALMKPTKGAVEAFHKLCEAFDVYLLSTAPWDNDTAWSDKPRWVKTYLGENAKKRLILSHNKHLNDGDYLVDDRLRNGADRFKGELILYGSPKFPDWRTVLPYLLKNA